MMPVILRWLLCLSRSILTFNVISLFQLARAAQELLMSVCMNCSQHDASDTKVVGLLMKINFNFQCNFIVSVG